mgnify:CR=1 FL=1
MAWKIERWLSEVFPGEDGIYAEYRNLPPRELAIVSAAVLDVALAELLSLRMADQSKETEEFLGLNGDGRAPAGSFGARIQMGLLVGLLTPEDAAILRAIKELRNLFAHRVRVDFLAPSVLKATTKLHTLWLNRTTELIKSGAINGTTDHLSAGDRVERFAGCGSDPVCVERRAFLHLHHLRLECRNIPCAANGV